MRSHAKLPHATFSRVPEEKKDTQFLPFMPLVPVVPSKINDKFRVANRFVQFKVCFRTVNMKKTKMQALSYSRLWVKIVRSISKPLGSGTRAA